LGKKKERVRKWIKQHQFDILVGFNPGPKGKNRLLIKDINANVKMGPVLTKADDLYQVNIRYDDTMKIPDFFEWVKKYYIQLNFNHNTNEN
jgi:hypothetical protein